MRIKDRPIGNKKTTRLTPLNLTMPDRGIDAPSTQVHVELESLVDPIHDERPVIFLLPGGPGADHQNYKKHSRELAQHVQLLYFDPRGCGQSSAAHPKSHTTQNYVDDLEEIRQQLYAKFGRPFDKITLLGASFGGMAALAWALKYQAHLDKLILVATAATHRYFKTADDNIRKIGTKKQIEAYEKLFNRDVESVSDVRTLLNILKPLYSLKLAKESKNPLAQKKDEPATSLHSQKNILFGWHFYRNEHNGYTSQFELTPELHTLLCPTLILSGEHDWVCDKVYAAEMAQHIPNAHLINYKHSGHLISIDAHEDYIRDILHFMRAT